MRKKVHATISPPVDCVVLVRGDRTRGFAFAAATGEPGSSPRFATAWARSRGEAIFAAVEHLIDLDRAVNLFTDCEELHNAVAESRTGLFSHVEPHERGFGAHGWKHDVLGAAIAALPDAETLTLATDGSFSRHDRVGGWAAVCANGRYMFGSARLSGSLAAELHAIHGAATLLGAVPAHVPILVLSDSLGAIRAATEESPVPPGVPAALVDQIRSGKLGRPQVSFQWVPAHSGHALNEAADRIAVAARRNRQARVARKVTDAIAARVAAEYVPVFTRGDTVSPSRSPVEAR